MITTSSQLHRGRRLLDMMWTSWRRRHDYAVALVDVYSGPAFVWAEAVCWTLRRARKPYVLTLHGGELPRFTARWPWRVRRLLRSAAAVTTPSRYLLEAMSAYSSRLVLLENALELEMYPRRVRSRVAPNLIWLRAFGDAYNPALAVSVVAALRASGHEASLAMIGPDMGDGSLERTKALARRLGVADHISFHAAVPKREVPAWLDRGDVLLNTPRIDNAPVSVVEAMACGLCVVSTRVGGTPYLIEEGVNGLLVPDEDAEGMAAAVRQLIQDPVLANRISSAALNTAASRDWSSILPRWNELLTEVATAS
ncbi:MAG TPA: glycosyltransferase family 4 protein [Gemmatimonadaceae bacterium]|nr:glycosyltransferase family 4 protein [Gemmatimonadaceae bacterium]